MLKQLVIDNIALIDHLELEFSEGLTVLSGETGSGKSIIIDSLSFVLGDRADKTLIKYGEDAAEVTALFQVTDGSVLRKLEEYGYGTDGEILLYRKMSVAGKNEIRIQGRPATLAILKEICAELVDIFGQGQHLALLNEKNQLSVLDEFCDHAAICDEMRADLYPQLTKINKELKSLGGDDAERERLLDILQYQITEISAVDPTEEEEEELLSAHKRMVNAEKLTTALGQAVGCLNGENGALGLLAQSGNLLRSVSNLEDTADEMCQRIDSARLDVDDVATQIQEIISSMEFSAAEVDRVEERLEKYRQLKRKYGGSVASVLQFLRDAQAKYDNLSNAAEKIEQLNAQKNDVITRLYKLALDKSAERKATADRLAQDIMRELDELGMRGTKFCVKFNEIFDVGKRRRAAQTASKGHFRRRNVAVYVGGKKHYRVGGKNSHNDLRRNRRRHIRQYGANGRRQTCKRFFCGRKRLSVHSYHAFAANRRNGGRKFLHKKIPKRRQDLHDGRRADGSRTACRRGRAFDGRRGRIRACQRQRTVGSVAKLQTSTKTRLIPIYLLFQGNRSARLSFFLYNTVSNSQTTSSNSR